MDFDKLKNNSRNKQSMAELTSKMSKFKKKSWVDENQWKPERDQNGNGTAIIRFLPTSKNDESPFVEIYTHSFKKNGQWFIHNCPTTLGEKCPVCEANSIAWEAGDEQTARDRKRTQNFWANIYIVKDAQNPSREGKVFKYRFGKKIMEKIQKAIDGDPSINLDGVPVVDFWEGADFILRSKSVKTGSATYISYDDSSFNAPSALLGGNDEALKEVWESQHSLSSIVDPKEFLSYDALKEKFNKTLRNVATEAETDTVMGDESLNEFRTSVTTQASQPTTQSEDPAPFDPTGDDTPAPADTSGEDPMAYFQGLADD